MNYCVEHGVAVPHCHWRASYRFLSGPLPRPVSGLPDESSDVTTYTRGLLQPRRLFYKPSCWKRAKTRARASLPARERACVMRSGERYLAIKVFNRSTKLSHL